jgi:hypothetical protein
VKTAILFNKLPLLLLGVVFAVAVGFFGAHPVVAVEGSASCTINGEPGIQVSVGVNGSQCIPLGDQPKNNPIIVFLKDLLKVVSGLVGLATVGGIIWGGMLYITARANAGQVEKAKVVIINSVIGLALFIFMFTILQFLIPGGIFS